LRDPECVNPELEICKPFISQGKYIKLSIEAKNLGKIPLEFPFPSWIYDSKQRVYEEALEGWKGGANIVCPQLKPAFSPEKCTKIFEVASDSTNLAFAFKSRDGKTQFIFGLGL
jgi:hypothetical protein